MKQLVLTLSLLLFCLMLNAQLLQNTKWKVYYPTITDTVTVEFKVDTIHQYIKSDSILVSSLYWEYSDTIKIVDVGGDLGCTNPDTGYFKFNIKGDSLYISLINDPCLIRGITYDGVVLWNADIKSSIGENENNHFNLKIYPNPAKAHTTVYVESDIDAVLEVYSLVGQRLVSKALLSASTREAISLNSGMYLIKLLTDKGVQTSKLVIE